MSHKLRRSFPKKKITQHSCPYEQHLFLLYICICTLVLMCATVKHIHIWMTHNLESFQKKNHTTFMSLWTTPVPYYTCTYIYSCLMCATVKLYPPFEQYNAKRVLRVILIKILAFLLFWIYFMFRLICENVSTIAFYGVVNIVHMQ